ncbi:MAG: 16S rRNA (guanine(527)-N(7))-methyltransferase RsmG [Candidatus Methylomirabilales bacterium]
MPPSPRTAAPEDLLLAGARALGLTLDAAARARFQRYLEELVGWSAHMNLTALRRPADIVREGFLDSLSLAPFIPASARRAVDIGSGAGFPAIPLAILRPDLAFTLVESIRKKVTFLRHAARTLGLPSVAVVQARAEAVAREPEHAGRYDVGMARAAAPLAEQAALVAPFLAPGGLFLAQAGQLPAGAVEAAQHAGLQCVREVAAPAPRASGRRVLVFARR